MNENPEPVKKESQPDTNQVIVPIFATLKKAPDVPVRHED